ncbi:MAG: homoserine kinase, partial [Coriobacteriia bacterium]|nr:homoserine kinase [Coriobacteriia bacterium]
MSARVIVPASSANLGPGYDSFGLALGIHNECEGELAREWRIEVGGEGAGRLSTGADNAVLRAMARLFEAAGKPGLRAEVICHNGIPVGRGLGSSSAAVVGGLVLADALLGSRFDRQRLLELATSIEGHPDNAGAALCGGFVIAARDATGVRCTHIEPAGGLAAVVVVGESELPTGEARRTLPTAVPHHDAAANAAAAALLAHGITVGSAAAIAAGMRDSIHERYRAHLVPDMGQVSELLGSIGAGPAVLSGAGPSMLALVSAGSDELALERARRCAEVARTA